MYSVEPPIIPTLPASPLCNPDFNCGTNREKQVMKFAGSDENWLSPIFLDFSNQESFIIVSLIVDRFRCKLLLTVKTEEDMIL